MAVTPGPPGEVGGVPGEEERRPSWLFPLFLALLIAIVIFFGGD